MTRCIQAPHGYSTLCESQTQQWLTVRLDDPHGIRIESIKSKRQRPASVVSFPDSFLVPISLNDEICIQ